MSTKKIILLGVAWGFFSIMMLGFGYSEKLNIGNKILILGISLPGSLAAETLSVLNSESPSLAMPVSIIYGISILFIASKLLKKFNKSKS